MNDFFYDLKGEKKPVVASMGDVAASGGYYLSMACKTIVAEPLTITGELKIP
jgi:protease-4